MTSHHAKFQLDSSKRSWVIPLWKWPWRQQQRRRWHPSGLNYSPRRKVFRGGQKDSCTWWQDKSPSVPLSPTDAEDDSPENNSTVSPIEKRREDFLPNPMTWVKKKLATIQQTKRHTIIWRCEDAPKNSKELVRFDCSRSTEINQTWNSECNSKSMRIVIWSIR